MRLQATGWGCENSCAYANDRQCDDGGVDSDTSLCKGGTDCTDCGYREFPEFLPRPPRRCRLSLSPAASALASTTSSAAAAPRPVAAAAAAAEGRGRSMT
jgi:hypothetical protein